MIGVFLFFILVIAIFYVWENVMFWDKYNISTLGQFGIVILCFVLLLIGIGIGGYIIEMEECSYIHTRYSYIDLDGIEGIAETCSYKFQAGHSGGQGSPVCQKEDGTVIAVKQYKKDVQYIPSYCEK